MRKCTTRRKTAGVGKTLKRNTWAADNIELWPANSSCSSILYQCLSIITRAIIYVCYVLIFAPRQWKVEKWTSISSFFCKLLTRKLGGCFLWWRKKSLHILPVPSCAHKFVMTNRFGFTSGNAFVSGARDLRFKSRAGQIGHSVAKGSPPLRHFFESCCVAHAQWRGDGPRQLVTRFGVLQRV